MHGKNFYAHEIEALVSEISGVKPGRTVAFGVDNPLSGSLDLVVVAEQNMEFDGNGNQANQGNFVSGSRRHGARSFPCAARLVD